MLMALVANVIRAELEPSGKVIMGGLSVGPFHLNVNMAAQHTA